MTSNLKMPMSSSATDQKNNSPSGTSNVVFRTAYSKKSRSTISFAPEGRTKQSFKDECDINRIMARFAKTGVFEHLALSAPSFGDVSDIDFQACMDVVAEARERFAMLPSELRDRFANDPARLLAFIQDASNAPEAQKLGLLRPPEPQGSTIVPPQATPVATPPADGVAAPQKP